MYFIFVVSDFSVLYVFVNALLGLIKIMLEHFVLISLKDLTVLGLSQLQFSECKSAKD